MYVVKYGFRLQRNALFCLGLNNLQSGVHRQYMKDLFVELCLTVPVRLRWVKLVNDGGWVIMHVMMGNYDGGDNYGVDCGVDDGNDDNDNSNDDNDNSNDDDDGIYE